ncbi:phytanoyl-CoA dioxygenase family protein [Streptomyces sp. SID5914]|nr:phytanoyl-CoA dioxygenase family protein [Streptomyces sp. SID5914]MZG19562.1 phytanoyl-CoA dioxygenase family protein [Streptomyces sp. SID5914]
MTTPDAAARPLTDEEVEDFRRDGVVCVRGLYTPEWVATIESALDAVRERPALSVPGVSASFRSDAFTWHFDDAVRDFVLYGPSAHIARQVFGSKKVNLFYDQIFIKEALTSDLTPWHHDASFWPLEGDQIASLWTSVDAVDANSSALEFIAGSHRWDKLWKPIGVGGIVVSSEPLEALPDIDAHRSDYRILSWALEPGDALLFHARTVHGAQGNKSPDTSRRAIATRWCGDDVVYRPRVQEMPIPWAHGLRPGDPLSGPVFPRVLPELDRDALAERMRGPVFPEPELMRQAIEQMTNAERVQVRM